MRNFCWKWRYQPLRKMYLLKGKIGKVILLQIAWQIACMFFGGALVGQLWGNTSEVFFFIGAILVFDVIGFVFTLLYRRRVAPTLLRCSLDFLFVLSGLIFGLPVGLALSNLLPHSRSSRSPSSIPDLVTRAATVIVLSIPVLIFIFFLRFLYCRHARLTAIAKRYPGIEEEGLGQGPQSFKYSELSIATKEFSSAELLGCGSFGSVYKGNLLLKGDKEPSQIAVKRIGATSDQGAQEFLAEVKIIGQVQHRNLVRVLGWCCEKNELMIVYNYMPNGNVAQHLHKNTTTGEAGLTWARRLRIMNDVATGLAYLHDEWEQRVTHNDVKSSNVMLDSDFNARLGDFGLARLSEHNRTPPRTSVIVGTMGYLAPELFKTLKLTEKTDVYSFGAMVLEVATGKKPLLSAQDRGSLNKKFLVDWVWSLYENNALLDAVDCKMENDYDPGEMTMFLKIGLLCCHPDPEERPTMREALHIWKRLSPFPPLSRSNADPISEHNIDSAGLETDVEDSQTAVSIFASFSGEGDKSGTNSPADSAYHSAVTIISEADGDSPRQEHTHEG